MFHALGLSVADLANRRVLCILLQATAISLAVFVLVAGLLVWLFTGADPCALVGIGSCALGVAGGLMGAAAITLVAAWFLFPAVAITVMTTFGERIAGAIEERHYPEAAREARRIGPVAAFLIGLKSASRLLVFNLIALPFYLLLLVTGVGPFILFVIVNGIAFGRDIAELAAVRHGDRTSRRTWLKNTRGQQHLIGVVVSILFLVPFANILAPVIGTAAGIHLFNTTFWKAKGARAIAV